MVGKEGILIRSLDKFSELYTTPNLTAAPLLGGENGGEDNPQDHGFRGAAAKVFPIPEWLNARCVNLIRL
jgi:hypothetical protein